MRPTTSFYPLYTLYFIFHSHLRGLAATIPSLPPAVQLKAGQKTTRNPEAASSCQENGGPGWDSIQACAVETTGLGTEPQETRWL